MKRYGIILLAACALLVAALFVMTGTGETPKTAKYESGLCAEHNVPDSLCTRCHPELISEFKKNGNWCSEHKLPEDQCYFCNPELAPTKHDHSEHAENDEHGHEADHVEHQTEDHPATSVFRNNAGHCTTDEKVIQLASVETAERAGLTIESISSSNCADAIEAPGEIEFDATSSYAVTSLVAGTLIRWHVQPGQPVRKGQSLATIESIEGANLKSECAHAAAVLALSQSAFQRTQELAKNGMTSLKEVQEAETDFLRAQADYKRAANSLRALGFSEAELSALKDDGDGALIILKARQAGLLVEQKVALGTVLAAGESIGLIAEPSKFWVEAQVRERELPKIRVGQDVELSSDGEALRRTTGKVIWVADGVDQDTRMGRIRVAVGSDGTKLRAHEFVRVKIAAQNSDLILIPVEAVQWEGCCNIVFAAETRDRFKPQKIQVQFRQGDFYAVTGIEAGKRIVTHGSYLLKTELMKSSLGAGCCGVGA